VSRYPDSKLAKNEVSEYEIYQLVVGVDVKDMTFKARRSRAS
jgi:hypothetical protein